MREVRYLDELSSPKSSSGPSRDFLLSSSENVCLSCEVKKNTGKERLVPFENHLILNRGSSLSLLETSPLCDTL